MPVLKYQDVDISKVGIGLPIKEKGAVYYSPLTYTEGISGNALVFQTPAVVLETNPLRATFQLVNKGYFFTLLEDLQNRVVDRIYTNSKKFFNGKEFSEDRIRNSLKKIIVIDEAGAVTVNGLEFDKNVKFFDSFKDTLAQSDVSFPVQCSCIFSIDRVVYDKRDVLVPIKITHVKVSATANKKKVLDCILGDSESEPGEGEEGETSEGSTSNSTGKDKGKGKVSDLGESCTSSSSSSTTSGGSKRKGSNASASEPEELETIVQNIDNLEFFE